MENFTADPTQRYRRVPQQSRSRDRVARILDAAAEQVVAGGVESLGTRGIAEAAGVPVASLYQYFADKDDILLALIERDLQEMDAQVMTDIEALRQVSIATIVRTTMGAFVNAYREHPAFIMIWLRGRTNEAIRDYCREHNRRIAEELYHVATDAGLLRDEADPCYAEIAIEIGDRLFQLAFESDMDGDPMVLEEAAKAVTAYLQLYAQRSRVDGSAPSGP